MQHSNTNSSGIATNLVKEHEIILRALEVLDKEVKRGRERKTINAELIGKIVEFSKIFIDRCHHGKEEKCLFPCLEMRGIPRENGPIGVMLMEHEMGRELVRKISTKLEMFKKGEVELEEIIDVCSEYIDLLRQHIFKENNILFPTGDEVVNEQDIEKTLKCYDGVENEVGRDQHARMEKLVEEVEKQSESSS